MRKPPGLPDDISAPLLDILTAPSDSGNVPHSSSLSSSFQTGKGSNRSSSAYSGYVPDGEGDEIRKVAMKFHEDNTTETSGSHEPIKYPSNVVKTSRFTFLNFLPIALLEQFRRLANIYFLVIGTLAAVGQYTSFFDTAISPIGVLVPLTTVVLISVIKEGVEDVKRHRADATSNSRPVHVVCDSVTGKVELRKRKDLQVGTIVLLKDGDEVPADIVVLESGGVQGASISYVDTAAIDGESNLKVKMACLRYDEQTETVTSESSEQSISQLSQTSILQDQIGSGSNSGSTSIHQQAEEGGIVNRVYADPDFTHVSGLNLLRDNLVVTAEKPHASIHSFKGSIEFKRLSRATAYPTNPNLDTPTTPTTPNPNPTTATVSVSAKASSKRICKPLSEENLLLRGSVLRATEWCVGIVIYTGTETKLSLNSKRPPYKISSIDRVVNRSLIVAISALICLSVMSMSFSIMWQNKNANAAYLCLTKDSLSNRFISDNGGGCMSGTTTSYLLLLTFITLYNNVICISMLVSLEVCYLCQSYYLQNDISLYCPDTDTPAECHSSSLIGDLGRVQYVLSDKTGTLTKNMMRVRRCYVDGIVYGAPVNIGHSSNGSSSAGNGGSSAGNGNANSNANANATGGGVSNGGGNSGKGPSDGGIHSLHEWQPLHQLAVSPSATDSRSQAISAFLRVMAACNTALIMPSRETRDSHHSRLSLMSNNNTSPELQSDLTKLEARLQAESPDEVALVLCAAEFGGRLLTQRTSSDICIKMCGGVAPRDGDGVGDGGGIGETKGGRKGEKKGEGEGKREVEWECDDERITLLAVNAFDSDRKRMSVLVRLADGTNMLLCKGADSAMFPLLTSTFPPPSSSSDHDAGSMKVGGGSSGSGRKSKNSISSFSDIIADAMVQVDAFAATGLRTLVLASRTLTDLECEQWLTSYRQASASVLRRESKLAQCARDIERDLCFLGAVAIEDELGDGVPEAITLLQAAGINVWMITGDKAETAMAIGRVCGFLKEGCQVEKLLGMYGEALRQRMLDLYAFQRNLKRRRGAGGGGRTGC